MPTLRQQGFTAQPNIIKVRQESYDIQRQSEPAVDSINQVSDNPLLNATILDGIFVLYQTGNTTSDLLRIRHGLGREFRGWMVVRNDRSDTKYAEDSGVNDRRNEILLLRGELDVALGSNLIVEISLLVF